jgi:hypothetical protein
MRDINEDARDIARRKMKTKAHLAAIVQNLKTMTLPLLGPPRKRAPA